MREQNEAVESENLQLRVLVTRLEARITELERQLRQSSKNSSKPPSSEPSWKKRHAPQPPSGKKPGGQAGHEGHHRAGVDEGHEVIEHYPEVCSGCGEALGKESCEEPRVHQVTDLAEIRSQVTEHRMHGVGCKRCGKVTRARKPAEVSNRLLGPRVTGLVSMLSGQYRMSKRSVETFVNTVLDIPISLGLVIACERIVSDKLGPVYEEAKASICTEKLIHADETGWHERHLGKDTRPYLWTAGHAQLSVFAIQEGRSQEQASALLGKPGELKAFLVTDRYSGYHHYPLEERQFCWAHLKRDFTAISEREEGGSALMGKKLLEQTDLLFHHYRAYDRDHTIDFAEFQRRTRPVQASVLHWLRMGAKSSCGKTKGTSKQLLKQHKALWTFVRIPFVPPTNNQAERDLRPAVLWRKTSHGTQSEQGSRFVERILTAVSTLRKQKRDVWNFLHDLMTGKQISLLPPHISEISRASPPKLAA